jgi:Cu(I)/Ag(I) efflux system outer membrane protein
MISSPSLKAARMASLCLALFWPILTGCSLAPDYIRPDPPIPESLGDPDPAGLDIPKLGWRDFFKDEYLKELIGLALENNRDLALASRKILETRARYGLDQADRFPGLNAESSAAYSNQPAGGSTGGTGSGMGGMAANNSQSSSDSMKGDRFEAAIRIPAWELDLFGRLKNMSEAAWQTYLSAREGERAVRISLIAQVAEAYLTERLARERLELTEDNFKSWRDSASFIEERISSGQSSLLELEQARGMVEFARVALAQHRTEIKRAENALNLILGNFAARPPARGESLTRQKMAELPAGLSSRALLARPDVLEAEHNLRASNANIGAARAAFFPNLSLTGSLGYMSEDLDRLFTGSASAWNFMPKLNLPLFSGGRNQANLDLAEIRKETAVIQYEKIIQSAFREVADTLMTRPSLADQFSAQKKYLAAQRRVLDLAVNRYTNGVVSYLEVLDAQRGVFQAELDLLNIRREQLVNDINLYRALGGGINDETGQTPAGGSPSDLKSN